MTTLQTAKEPHLSNSQLISSQIVQAFYSLLSLLFSTLHISTGSIKHVLHPHHPGPLLLRHPRRLDPRPAPARLRRRGLRTGQLEEVRQHAAAQLHRHRRRGPVAVEGDEGCMFGDNFFSLCVHSLLTFLLFSFCVCAPE